MYGDNQRQNADPNKPKIKMDPKLYSEEKIRTKKIKIGIKVENLKEKINKIFDADHADKYIRRKTINALKRDLKNE